MNSRAETRGASLDTIKLAVAAFLLAVGIFAFYYFSGLSSLLRVIGLLVVGGVAAAIALQTGPGRFLWQFVGDARMEVRKVVWPSRQETLQTTLVVIAMVFVVGIVLWLFDMVLMAILRFLTGQVG
ncbi:preprotein translocase subunit SecE [Thiocystis violascens]|uniref:Protein translocase subunit SecE n=1 Tax=Thiocystis violascens (strain ATCC 17096 / DSM 198 / 6111) TaxID=765911 RepID=I3YG83_THIV6|nr:preprotein translocase subunit SecE [Thiocystis violascens]AFL76001.1 preprotein translocase, SecE subunit [Thiocystis violascens DSM 198]